MSQVAQQDHLYIEVADVTNPTDAEKAQIVSAYKRNVLDDVIFVSPYGHYAILSWTVDDPAAPAELTVCINDSSSFTEITVTL